MVRSVISNIKKKKSIHEHIQSVTFKKARVVVNITVLQKSHKSDHIKQLF